jgi:S1-C subfamily serine protease
LGSSFVFRYSHRLLTAAHCVGKARPAELRLLIYATGKQIYPVKRIHVHPKADVAVLEIEGVDETTIGWPVYSLFDDRGFGTEVMSCGFPEDVALGQRAPTGRVFRGHVQRFMDWRSHLGYEYSAAELSFRCPGGLSGGPLVNPEFPGRLYGVITEDIQTSNILNSIEEVHEDGKVYREHYQNFINYGIAVWLPAIADWLDNVVPPVPQEELARRGELQHKLQAQDRASGP